MLTLILTTLFFLAAEPEPQSSTVIVIRGADGAPEFGELFHEWSESWRKAAEQGSADFQLIGANTEQEAGDLELVKRALALLKGETTAPLWIVLIGHGTFDGRTAKFNLRGPDLDANNLAEWLAEVKRPTAIINCTSASAPFINRLAGPDRVVITATRSGNEQNFAHFGEYMASALLDAAADLDKDGQVSLLEGYLTACRRVEEFYDQEARLATEHPLIDDNGDGLGTPASWFRGLRPTQSAKAGASLDGTRAHQFHLIASEAEREMPGEIRQQRDSLEQKLASLRLERSQLQEDEYYLRLEPLLIDLARIYESLDGEPVGEVPSIPR